MGQTLTHGVYLPSEGERNCYSGLASNWRLLDGAIGTVAAHTTAIAGKANISHTHGNITNDGKVGTTANLPLITGTGGVVQAGSFGNSANTFCEGNDSRLSDARTPVAHTHTKSDITNLFNSANEWTNTQTYSAGSYGQKILLKNAGLDLSVNGNTGLSDTYQHVISWVDKNNTTYSAIQSWASDANNTLVLRSYYRTDASTSRNLSVRFVNTATDKSVYPETNGDVNFGISSNQWNNLYAKKVNTQSVNGINPGALSLPDLNTAQNIDRTGWAYDGSTYNSIKLSSTDTNMTKNGWLYVRISSTGSSDKLSIKYNSIGDKYPTSSFGDTGGCIEVFVPVIANSNVYLCATKDLQFCKFYPCLGNV